MLPEGTYTVTMKMHPKSHYMAMYLQSADHSHRRYGYILHGNGLCRRKGACIIVGNHLIPGVVTNSLQHFEDLMEMLEDILLQNGKMELQIM